MKKFETAVSSAIPEAPLKLDDTFCGKCGINVTFRGYSIRCIVCSKWFHRKCTPLSVDEIKAMERSNWHCGCAQKETPRTKLFGRYMDDILRSAKSNDIDKILERVNKLHPNLEFTIESQQSGCLPFLDMMVKQTNNHVEKADGYRTYSLV